MSQFDYERDPKSGDMVRPDEPAEVARRVRKQRQEVKLLKRVAEAASNPELIDSGFTGEHNPEAMEVLREALKAWREGK